MWVNVGQDISPRNSCESSYWKLSSTGSLGDFWLCHNDKNDPSLLPNIPAFIHPHSCSCLHSFKSSDRYKEVFYLYHVVFTIMDTNIEHDPSLRVWSISKHSGQHNLPDQYFPNPWCLHLSLNLLQVVTYNWFLLIQISFLKEAFWLQVKPKGFLPHKQCHHISPKF